MSQDAPTPAEVSPPADPAPPSAPPPERPRIGVGKALLYTLLANLLLLVVLEGVAALLEPHFFPYQRTLPVPAPRAPGAFEFGAQADEARRELGRQGKLPDLEHMQFPLIADADRKWALKPDTELNIGGIGYRVNRRGMRGADLPPPVEGEIRIMTFGDSSIFGDGLEEHDVFSTVAAASLAGTWQRKVLGVIGAVPGHDSGQSLGTLLKYGKEMQPTWILIGNLWSDVYRSSSAFETVDGYQYLPPVKGVLRRSALYRALWQLMGPWLRSQEVRWITSRDDIGELGAASTTRVSLPNYVQNLRRMVADGKRLGARSVFLTLPAPMDFDRVPVPDTVTQFRAAMRVVAEETGSPLIDGPAEFKRRGASIAYFSDQVHPSSEGHFLLGELLADTLAPFGPPPAGKSHYAGWEPDPSFVPDRKSAPSPDFPPMGDIPMMAVPKMGDAPRPPPVEGR